MGAPGRNLARRPPSILARVCSSATWGSALPRQIAPSNIPPTASSMFAMSPWTKARLGGSGVSFAFAIIAGDESIPVTSYPLDARNRLCSPVPEPRSRTRPDSPRARDRNGHSRSIRCGHATSRR